MRELGSELRLAAEARHQPLVTRDVRMQEFECDFAAE